MSSAVPTIIRKLLQDEEPHEEAHEPTGCGGEEDGSEYDLQLHVAAVFILLAVSIISALLPVLGMKYKSLRFNATVLAFLRCFGTGVIIATAFIHMLPPAFEMLTNPCLPAAFSEDYGSFFGLFAMVAAFFVHVIEFVATKRFENLYPGAQPRTTLPPPPPVATNESPATEDPEDDYELAKMGSIGDEINMTEVKLDSAEPPSPMTTTPSGQPELRARGIEEPVESRISTDSSSTSSSAVPEMCNHPHHAHEHSHHSHTHSHSHSHSHFHLTGSLSEEAAALRDQVIVYILELGIAFHSVIIGIALGIVTEGEFTTLLIAISFHQFFEGLGLGASLVEAKFRSFRHVLSMVVFYGLTTPIGIAIGIGISSTFDENSATASITQGIFDSVSAGILIYMSIVELMTHHMTSSSEFRKSSTAVKIGSFGCMYIGAFAMSLIGRWA